MNCLGRTQLTSLSTEVFASVVHWLNGHQLTRLWFCGSGTLNRKLSQPRVVRDFILQLDGSTSLVWPKLLSVFPTLGRLSITTTRNDYFVLQGVDLSLIPSTVTDLELKFANDWWALFNSPLEPDDDRISSSETGSSINHHFVLKDHFPNLQRLSCREETWLPFEIRNLVRFLPSSLTSITLPRDNGISTTVAQSLPMTLHHLEFDCDAESWDQLFQGAQGNTHHLITSTSTTSYAQELSLTSYLPPYLTSLAIFNIPNLPALHMPTSLTELKLIFNKAVSSDPHWSPFKQCGPLKMPNLVKLSFNAFSFDNTLATSLQPLCIKILTISGIRAFDQDAVHLLPRTLESWEIPNIRMTYRATETFFHGLPPNLTFLPHLGAAIKEDFIPLLPRGLKWLRLAPKILDRTVLLQLPPNLEVLHTHYLRPSHVSILPKTLTHLEIYNFKPPNQVAVQLEGEPKSLIDVLSVMRSLIVLHVDDPSATGKDLRNLPPTLRDVNLGISFVPSEGDLQAAWARNLDSLVVSVIRSSEDAGAEYDEGDGRDTLGEVLAAIAHTDTSNGSGEDPSSLAPPSSPSSSSFSSSSGGAPRDLSSVVDQSPISPLTGPKRSIKDSYFIFSAYHALPRNLHTLCLFGELRCSGMGWEMLPPNLTRITLANIASSITDRHLAQLPKKLKEITLRSKFHTKITSKAILEMPFSLETLILPISPSANDFLQLPIRPPTQVLIAFKDPKWSVLVNKAYNYKYRRLRAPEVQE